MRGIQVYLADANYDGPIAMSSTTSQIMVTRVAKARVSEFYNELNGPGIYFLLIGSDSVYVGQTGLDTLQKRIMNTHSGNIDSQWHTVVGFKFTNTTISSNELQYIENAMCEYAHANYTACLTTNPAKTNCNAQYRNQHYHLNSGQIHSCNQYIKDIKFYLSIFPNGIFPNAQQNLAHPSGASKELFYYQNPSRDVDGKAEILINCGHTKARQAILKAGSKISTSVSSSFGGYQNVINHRQQLEIAGKIVNRILQVDIPFSSQSGAGQFLNGTSFNGNTNWKTVNGDKPLKSLL